MAGVLLGACIALSAAVCVQAVACVLRYRDPVPFWDMVSLLRLYVREPAAHFWLMRDNEHLPLVAMPFFWLDIVVFHAKSLPLVAMNLLLAASAAVAVWPAVHRAGRDRPVLALAVAALAAAVMLWLGDGANLIWPKQVHMFLATATAFQAFRIAARVAKPGLADALAIALWLVASSFSFGYGLVGFAAMAVLAVLRRWPVRAAGVLAAAAALTIAATAVLTGGFRTSAVGGVPPSPATLAGFAARMVSAPAFHVLRDLMPDTWARPVALALALLVVLTCLPALRRAWRGQLEEIGAWRLLLLAFASGTGLLIALGRARYGADYAYEPRYVLCALPFWVGLILAPLEPGRPGKRGLTAAIGVAFAACAALLLASQATERAFVREGNGLLWQAAASALDGVEDTGLFRARVFPDLAADRLVFGELRARRWSVFADPQAAWIGQPIGAWRQASHCRGALLDAESAPEVAGERAAGWAAGPQATDWVLLVDGQDKVRGLAHRGIAVAAIRDRQPPLYRDPFAGWRGYLPGDVDAHAVSAWLVLADGAAACRLPDLRQGQAPHSG